MPFLSCVKVRLRKAKAAMQQGRRSDLPHISWKFAIHRDTYPRMRYILVFIDPSLESIWSSASVLFRAKFRAAENNWLKAAPCPGSTRSAVVKGAGRRDRSIDMEKDAIIDTEQLRAFEAVANTGSFTRAAAVLGVAQSSISQQINRLEKRAGRRLINRTTRRVELTPAGGDMLIYVRSILAMAADARRRLDTPPTQGSVRVGIADEFATTKLASVLAIFRKQHPRFEMRFLTGRNDYLYDALEADRVDIILGKSRAGRKRGEHLWREPLVWVGQPYAVEGGGSQIPLITYLRPSETREVAEAALLKARRTWSVVAESDNLLGLLAAAEAGLGVIALGKSFVPLTLVEMPSSANLPPLGSLDYVIDYRTQLTDPAVIAFADVLREVARQLAQETGDGLKAE
jgi:DNA-binding transcriptional LysR family regulator